PFSTSWLMDFNLTNWNIGVLADWASISALLIALYNAYQITRVRGQIVLNLTLSSLLGRLQDNSQRMNESLLLQHASSDSFDEIVEICEANVRAVRRRLGLRRGRFCLMLLSSIAAYRRRRDTETARS